MIRPFAEHDRQYFCARCHDFYHSDAVMHPIPDEYIARTFDEVISGSPYAQGYIAEAAGKRAGYLLVSLTYSNGAGGLVVWVEEAFVEPSMRGKGVGKELFSFLPQQYPHAKRFRLEVTHTNEGAIRLYHKLGYEDFDYLQMVCDRP